MLLSLLALSLPLAAPGACAACAAPRLEPTASPTAAVLREDTPSDKALRRRWEALSADDQAEVAEWFSADVEWLDTFQLRLLRHVLGQQEQDAGFWPEAAELPVYDPAVEAPRQPISRKPVEASSSSTRRRIEALSPPARRGHSTWAYDWTAGGLVRTGDDRASEHVFENALAGRPPGADLAEALILASLDRGDERLALTAWGHAYTDRYGRVYPIPLYDAWASGAEIEMPDVDTLGIYRFLGGARSDYTAPVPNSAHRKFYGELGDAFRAAQRYRAVRESMARTYLAGTPVLPSGYEANLDRLHSLWEEHSSEIGPVVDALPDAEAWESFFNDLVERCSSQAGYLQAGLNRRATLDRDGAALRAHFVTVLVSIEGS